MQSADKPSRSTEIEHPPIAVTITWVYSVDKKFVIRPTYKIGLAFRTRGHKSVMGCGKICNASMSVLPLRHYPTLI
jgi:hypothetical protein